MRHLRSGLFGRAAFARGARPALLIPRAALVERGQLRGIYVVDANQIAELRYVTLGNDHRRTSRSSLRPASRRETRCRARRPGTWAANKSRSAHERYVPPDREGSTHVLRLAGRIAHIFIQSKLTPLVIVAALLLGVFSILQTPREEEPQIVVPMLDVFVQMPGASAQEVTQRATVPMEKLLRELPGVEYIYSISHPGLSMVIVRFYVGTKEEDAIVQTYNKLYSNFDRIPQGVSQPLSKCARLTMCRSSP